MNTLNLELLTLPQWSLTGALLISAAAILRWLLGGRPGFSRAIWPLLWWLVALRLLLPFSLPCPVSVQNLLSPPNSAPQISATANYTNYGTVNYGTVNFDNEYNTGANANANNHAEPTGQTAATPLAAANSLVNIWRIIWAVGAATGAAYFSLVYWRSRRRFQQAEPLDGPEIQQWLAEHPLRRPVRVCQTPDIASPLTYGLLHPVILLPNSLPNPSPPALHFALLHEWTHIRRFDAVAKLLAAAALCLHWFNPAVWLFFWLFNRDIELACDESVVRRCGASMQARRDYALALLNWAEERQPLPLYSSFGLNPKHNQNVITERIVAIMNIKKVSIISLAAALCLLACTAAAFATNATAARLEAQSLDELAENYLAEYDYFVNSVENLSDEEIHQFFSQQVRTQMALALAPYEQFGLTWSFDDPDYDGQGLKMYYQGREVRGIRDETQGMWFTEHAGYDGYAPDAVELYTVYTDGQLSGLRFANAEEQQEWDQKRRQPMNGKMEPYEQFGLTYNDEGRLVYNGQLVRYFWDGYEVYDGDVLLGRAIHCEYTNLQSGEIDLRTRRDVINNPDGSVNQFGPLLGLEVYTEENINDMTAPPLQRVTYSIVSEDTVANGNSLENHGLTIAEHLAQYAEYGLEYREQVMSDGTHRDVFFNGELVAVFVDEKPNGGGFSVQSNTRLSGEEKVVMTEYDMRGNLTGLRLATPEEANQRLQRPKSVGFRTSYDENGELTLYYTTDENRTFQAVAKPE